PVSADCTYPTLNSTGVGKSRSLDSFELTDGTNSGKVTVNQQKDLGSALYFDKTDQEPFVTFAGSELRFKALTWNGEWMHGYLYADYDGDGEFDPTLNVDGTTGGELVSYSYYNGTNSNGNVTANNAGVTAAIMPSFTLPADIAPGDYNFLFKIDWNNTDPCGASEIANNAGCAVRFTVRIQSQVEYNITVKSSDESMGTVRIEGFDSNSVTTKGMVSLVAVAKSGCSFVNWTEETSGRVLSTMSDFAYNGNSDITIVGNFKEGIDYPVMSRTFTNNSSQENRYLKSVTTTGTLTPTVFDCATVDDLPYTAFTASGGTYVESGANIDKTATPIVVENGVTSFDMTYFGWNNAINGRSSEMSWVQEACFVDWNKDGRFYGNNEISDKGWSSMPNSSILTTSGSTRTVRIPEGTEAGSYRMRVVFFEPAQSSEQWQTTLFTTLENKIRNGISYDFIIEVAQPKAMELSEITVIPVSGKVNPGETGVKLASVKVTTTGVLNPIAFEGVELNYNGTDVADISNLRWIYSNTSAPGVNVVSSADKATAAMKFSADHTMANGDNYYHLVADVAAGAVIGNTIGVTVTKVLAGGTSVTPDPAECTKIVSEDIDYTRGNALWFDSPNSSTAGVNIWNRNDFSTSSSNPDQIWEQKSFPIGNGSFGGNVLGSVNRERVVLNEKTLWKGGPGTGASAYWDMNRTVSDATLSQIRTYLENGQTSSANSLVQSNYSGKINYDKNKFGVFTTMGEAYVSTGITESSVTDYKRIMNIDRSLVVVQFKADNVEYSRKYFSSYPDNVMVWNYTSDGGTQDLQFSFSCPQIVNSVEAVDGGLLYRCSLDNNGMEWAFRVYARVNGSGTVTTDATARTISVSGANDVDFILAADTDYKMNFTPDYTDPHTYVGVDPVASVNEWIDEAIKYSYDELYSRHYDDYSNLYGRTKISINPSIKFENLPTPTRLANYRQGTLDHELEQMYFQYGRYLLISSSREGTMPANLQGLWHNNTDGPWRVDYHNNINLQMNYWPATCTNLLECFTPFVDYVRSLVEPGKRTAQAYYGARGWTAEVSTNIFGFTAPLNSTDMSWNYNPTAGPWLATQIWEYYDYTRDEEWLRNIGYDIIKSSADFCSDLLYLANGTYTSAPSYSPEHGSVDLGATYANAVTREILAAAIKAATVLGKDAESVAEWQEKLDRMYPYQIGRYGQLQEWYNDIDTYGDTHRHTNHLFGLHPGSTIDPLVDTELADACKETLNQRGDAATGWSMGWKLNHWARLLDGDHAYVLFRNLLKEGTADNMWDMHPPFQIDGNFGGTAGIAELFLQSHTGRLHLLPALPSDWTDGCITGLLARGNFVVDITYAGGKLDHAVITSNVGEKCNLYYGGRELSFATVPGGCYEVRVDPDTDRLVVSGGSTAIDDVAAGTDNRLDVYPNPNDGHFNVAVSGKSTGSIDIRIYSVSGKLIKSLSVAKHGDYINV
ncbi:MAG: glycoside hydrolase N-terminal domain-containing protein, partial [Muribaculaceae bacterium]|nr:glycoside hydrolase N-terminal domain-containing protein [Muribaculaceae bacterium]